MFCALYQNYHHRFEKIGYGSGFLKCPQSVQFEAKYELALTYLEYGFSYIKQCEFYEKVQIRA